MVAQQDIPPVQTVQQATPPRRRWSGFQAFVTAAVAVLIIGAGVAAVGLMDMWDAGDRMASTEALPADTQLYVGVDFQSMEALDPMLLAFDSAFAEADISPGLDGLVARIDQQLRAEIGIGVVDITPWAGRDLGISVADIEAERPTIVAAVSVRDEAGADEFIDLMIGTLASRDLLVFSEASYAEVPVYVSDTGFDDGPLVVARSADMLLIGNGVEAVHRAIDAHNGASLADDTLMQTAVDELPSDRALTVFVRGEVFSGLFGELTTAFPAQVGAIEPFGSMAMSVTLVEDGVQIDVVEPVNDESRVPAGSLGSDTLPELLPASTFGYVGVRMDEPLITDDGDLGQILSDLGASPADLEGIEELEAALGFDIESDLLRHLGGDFGFAMLESTQHLFQDVEAPRMGMLAMIGVMDAMAVSDTTELMSAALAEEGIATVERDVAGSTMYAFSDGAIEFGVFGVAGDHLVVATNSGDVAALGDNGAKLADDPLFVRASEALPDGSDPMFFFDVRRAMDQWEIPAADQEMIDPIAGLVAYAEETADFDRFSMLVLIDY